MENTENTKKQYETPVAEKVNFSYRQQVVVASSDECDEVWTKKKGTRCADTLVSYGD